MRQLSYWTVTLCSCLAIIAGVGGTTPLASAQPYTRYQTISVPGAAALFSAVAADGSTAVYGRPEEAVNGLTGAGAIYVYTKSGFTWTLQARLTSPTPLANERFGYDVAISGDTIVAGMFGAISSSLTGSAYVFVRSGTTWTLQQALTHTSSGSSFAMNIALHGDTAAATSTSGVYVYTRSGTSWTRQGPFTGSNASVDLSADAMCVSSYVANGAVTVRVFGRSGGSWVVRQTITPPATGFTGSPTACAIDGDTLVSGIAPSSTVGSGAGAAFVYARTSSGGVDTWNLQQRLDPSPAPAYAGLGNSVDVSGNYVVLGAAAIAAGRPDASFAFERIGTTWTEVQRFGPGASQTGYGLGVAVSGDDLHTSAGLSVELYTRAAVPTGPPSAPTSFQATANGNTVSLSWGAPASGAAPTRYTLIARTLSGALVTSVPLGVVNSFTANAPSGTYVLTLTASNASGTGPESTARTVTVGTVVVAPGAPAGLGATVTGSTVTFTWSAPASGGAPTGYTLLAGTRAGFTTTIAALPLPAAPLSATVAGVPNGTYFVRLLATNAGGTSAASNEVTLTVGTVVTVPTAPTMNAPAVTGRTVSLSWSPGTGGGAPSSYTLTARASAGGPALVTVPITSTSASFTNVPSGTYVVSVTGTNAAGTSGASNQVSLTVP